MLSEHEKMCVSGLLAILASFILLFLIFSQAQAHPINKFGCVDLALFAKGVAMQRDNGIPKDDFMAQLEKNINKFKGRPDYRTLLQDKKDEYRLVMLAERVYKHNVTQDQAYESTLNSCIRNAKEKM